MTALPPPFPARLRPAPSRRRRIRRRVLLALAGLGAATALALAWRVDRVEVSACDAVPAGTVASLRALEGSPVLLLSLDRVRRQLEIWPGVVAVEARLVLPGTLRVTARPAVAAGSLRWARGWRAVAPDGRTGVRIEAPLRPELVGFSADPREVRQGLVVAQRLERASGFAVRRVRRILPGDLEVTLVDAEGEVTAVVHVTPEGTAAETWWTARLAAGREARGSRADLRWADRVVVGGSG